MLAEVGWNLEVRLPTPTMHGGTLESVPSARKDEEWVKSGATCGKRRRFERGGTLRRWKVMEGMQQFTGYLSVPSTAPCVSRGRWENPHLIRSEGE
jgi:hypothetical protein